MKRLNEQEVEQYLKQALEKDPSVQPSYTSDELLKKIKAQEKRHKQRKLYRKIPVYGSSFIAIVAMVFLFLEVPKSSDHFVVQNEKSMADVERAYEEIQNATTMMKTNEEEPNEPFTMSTSETSLNDYPSYIPTGYTLFSEEVLGEGKVLTYEKDEHRFIVQILYGEQAPIVIDNPSLHQIEQKRDNMTLLISGDLSEEELTKILESMY